MTLNRLQSVTTAILALISLAVLAGCSQDGNRDTELLAVDAYADIADVYVNQGQFRSAAIEIRNALDIAPGNARARLLSARVNMELGSYGEAFNILNELGREFPGDPDITLLLGETLINIGNAEQAVELLDGIQMQEPTQQTRLNWLLALAHVQQGNNQQGRDLLESNLASNSDHIESLITLSQLALSEGDLENSRALMEQAIAVDANNLDLWIWRGVFAMLEEQYAEAELAYFEALEIMAGYDTMTAKRLSVMQSILLPLQLQQKNDEALRYSQIIAETPQGQFQASYTSAIDFFQQGDFQQAEAALQAAINTAPDNPDSNILIGMAQYAQGDYDSAVASLERFAGLATSSADPIKTLAATHIQLGNPERAYTLLEDAQDRFPDDPSVLAMLGISQQLTGRVNESITTLTLASEQLPEATELMVSLANSHNLAGDPQTAAELLLRAIELDGSLRPPKVALFNLYVEQQDFDSAREQIQNWLAADPESEFLNNTAARLAFIEGDYPQAREFLNTSLTLNPGDTNARAYLARVAAASGSIAEADRVLDEILAADPAQADALSLKLSIGQEQGDTAQRVSDIENLVRQYPEEFVPAFILSQFFINTADLDRALEFGKIAYERTTNNIAETAYVGLLLNQVNTSIQAGDFDMANSHLEEVREIQPDSPDGFELEGELYLVQQQFENAVDSFRQAWQARMTDNAGVKLYNSLQFAGQADEAERLLDEWVEADANSGSANLLLGQRYLTSGQESLALDSFEIALQSLPDNILALNNMAWLLQDTAPGRALELASRAAELAPENADILDTYGWVLFKNGNREQAISVLEQAQQLAPRSQGISDHLEEARR